MSLLHLPNQIRFQIGRECATRRGSKLTYSPGRQQLELSDLTWKICLPANIKQIIFSQAVCSILELEGITNHLMTGPTRNSEFLCGTKTHRFPWGQSLCAFQSMIMHEMFALIKLAWKVSVAFEFRWKRKCGWIFPSSHFYQCGKRRFWFWILNMFSSCHWMNLVSTMVYMVV